jgi:hypothetical protein
MPIASSSCKKLGVVSLSVPNAKHHVVLLLNPSILFYLFPDLGFMFRGSGSGL